MFSHLLARASFWTNLLFVIWDTMMLRWRYFLHNNKPVCNIYYLLTRPITFVVLQMIGLTIIEFRARIEDSLYKKQKDVSIYTCHNLNDDLFKPLFDID